MFYKEFFRGKKILVTGHTGFKGTWLLGMLEKLESRVYGYALDGSEEDGFYHALSPQIVKSNMGYIQQKEKVVNYIKDISPEIVIHLASHSTLNSGDEISHYIFESNVMGVVNLLEGIRQADGVKAVLIVTSDKCYENHESGEKYKENSVLGAQDPYSTSKACQELVTECYRKSFFGTDKLNISIATARASNVIGGGDDNMTRLFPYLLNCFSTQKTAEIRKPKAVRPWQNVLDVLGGYLTLIQKLYENVDVEISSAFNFGPEDDGFVTVEEVAKNLKEKFKNSDYIVSKNDENIIETNVLKLDSTKAKKVLGWKPMYSFLETLEMAVEFEKRKKSENIREITMDLIGRYLDKI